MGENEQTSMSLERFCSLIAAYGADAGRWPQDERAAAHALLAVSASAREHLESERALDLCLDILPAPKPSAQLEAQILQSARRVSGGPAPQMHTAPASGAIAGAGIAVLHGLWRPASMFCTAAMLGIILGLNIMGPLGSAIAANGTSDDVLAYAFPTFVDGESGQ